MGVVGRLGCFACSVFEALGYDFKKRGEGCYDDHEMVHRMVHGYTCATSLAHNVQSFKEQCHASGDACLHHHFTHDQGFQVFHPG